MLSLEWFLHGLASMSPIGVFLPWREVIILASHSGWSAELCRLAAETLLDLGAVEVQFWQEGSVHDPQKYKSIHVLPIPEILSAYGAVDVSSDEEETAQPASQPPQPQAESAIPKTLGKVDASEASPHTTSSKSITFKVPIQPYQNA